MEPIYKCALAAVAAVLVIMLLILPDQNTPSRRISCPVPERPSRIWYRNMLRSIEQVKQSQLYYSPSDTVWMLGYVTWQCPPGLELVRLGPLFEGGKNACLPPQARGSCLVYSLGSNGQFEFEEQIWQRLGCEVHTFDCTWTGQSPGYVHYHPWCLGAPATDPNTATSLSFAQMIHRMGHQSRQPLIVKMDIEGWEWPFFVEYFSDKTIPRFAQLLIEIHDARTYDPKSGVPSRYARTVPIGGEWKGGENSGVHVKAVLNALMDLDEEFDMVAKEHNTSPAGANRDGEPACIACSEFTFTRRDYNWSQW